MTLNNQGRQRDNAPAQNHVEETHMDTADGTPEYFVLGSAEAEGELVVMVTDKLVEELSWTFEDNYRDGEVIDKRLEVAMALVRAGLQGRVGIERDPVGEPTNGHKQELADA